MPRGPLRLRLLGYHLPNSLLLSPSKINCLIAVHDLDIDQFEGSDVPAEKGGEATTGAPPPPPPPDPSLAAPPKIGSPESSGRPRVRMNGRFPAPAAAHKPTAKVEPFSLGDSEEGSEAATVGLTGLRNLGNTCFMNSTLQVLLNTPEIRNYFLKRYHLTEVNEGNVLGLGGELALGFGAFCRDVWEGGHRVAEPAALKELMGRKAAQFVGFLQHDAQELLSFLLDGLHEDLNRVAAKPYAAALDADGRPDKELAARAWDAHKARNDSLIVDALHGQLKSRLECPGCGKVSITFDPYVYLPVPFPKKTRAQALFFWPVDAAAKPRRVVVEVEEDARIGRLLELVGAQEKVKPELLQIFEVYAQKIYRVYDAEDKISEIMTADVMHVWATLDPEAVGEPVWNVTVIQRLVWPPNTPLPKTCSFCQAPAAAARLKACSSCYRSFYCDAECQKSHWAAGHSADCKAVEAAEASPARLKHMMQSRAINSVEVFMPPQTAERHMASSPTSPVAPPLEDPAPMDTAEEPGTSGAMDVDGPAPGQTHALPDAWAPEAKRPASASSKVRVSLDSESGGGYRLFHIRALRSDSKDAKTLYSHDNPKGKPIVPSKDDPSAPIPRNGEPRVLGLDWLNKLGTEDFLYVETKKEIDCEESADPQPPKPESGDLKLSELLHLFTQTEQLSPEEAWYCGSCKAHVEASKTLSLWRLPPVQIIQLKRFIYTSNHVWRNKDDRSVIYPHLGLDLAPFLSAGAPAQETAYDLYGVVCHMGSSFFGHYISYANFKDAAQTEIGWRCFDDSRVTQCGAGETAPAQKDAAYLLFYRRRDLDSGDLLARYDVKEEELSSLEARFGEKMAALAKSVEEEEALPTFGPALPPPEPEEAET